MDFMSLLGGELPTNRLGGLVDPGFLNGISGGNVHVNNWGYNPLTIRGMNHQVVATPQALGEIPTVRHGGH